MRKPSAMSKRRLLVAVAILLTIIYLVMVVRWMTVESSEVEGHEEFDRASVSIRTSQTEVPFLEHVSTVISEWNYFRAVNPHLMGVYENGGVTGDVVKTLDISPRSREIESARSALTASENATLEAWRTEDARHTFNHQSWSGWYEYLWRKLALGGKSPSTPTQPLGSLCDSNILLRYAPWCGFDRDVMADALAGSNGARTPTRDELLRNAARIVEGASRHGKPLNSEDDAMIREIKWMDWRNATPLASGTGSATSEIGATFIEPHEVSGDSPGGSVFLRRLGRRYPLVLAMRKEEHAKGVGSSRQPFDSDDDLIGFHACMFGSKRNLSQTIGGLMQMLLEPTRPQRLHVVSSTDGVDQLLPDFGGDVSKARAHFLNEFLRIVSPIASTLLVSESNLPTKHHGCVICRGFFPRELCRASILKDIAMGVPTDLVMIFRPDMHMWNPVQLNPYIAGGEVEVEPGTPSKEQASAALHNPHETISKWRLKTKPLWSLVVDKGFLPTTFGVINDINLTMHTIVVHCRVTLPLDLHWIGDPVIVGHWEVMNHWLEMFSIMTSTGDEQRFKWIDSDAGEIHHAKFYRQYMRPMFDLATEAGVAKPIDLRMFDFQFSLFRSDPLVHAQIMDLSMGNGKGKGPQYVTYQETTIFTKFATKWDYGECMRYNFVPKQFNVTSFYTTTPILYFSGEIGRVKMHRIPINFCSAVRTPPGIQTCFAQYQRIVYYKKGRNIHNPCKPYCGVFPILYKEGLCVHVGNKGPKQRYLATLSKTPMVRNASGEVLRFNLINPQYVIGDKLWFEKQQAIAGNNNVNSNKQTSGLDPDSAKYEATQKKRRKSGHDDEAEEEDLVDTAATPKPPATRRPQAPLSDGTFRKGSKRYRFQRQRAG